MADLTKEELSLLLFFETCAVDHAGAVNTVHMNGADFDIADRWDASGFVGFGRIASAYLARQKMERGRNSTCWCRLSPEAWKLAHAERLSRATRLWDKRSWRTTAEVRAEPEEERRG